MSAADLRPRTGVELVDAAFVLLRRHYLVLLGASLAVFGPIVLLYLVVPPAASNLVFLLSNLMHAVAGAATVVIVSEAYLGRTPSVRAALGAVGARGGSLIVAALVQGILIVLGLFLLIVPGLIAIAWTFAMPMAIMLEGAGAGESLGRSRELVRGQVPRVLAILAVTYAVFIAVTLLVGLTVELLLAPSGAVRVAAAVGELAMVPFYPAIGVVETLLYYDLRIRKEGFDLELMSRELAESERSAAGARRARDVPDAAA